MQVEGVTVTKIIEPKLLEEYIRRIICIYVMVNMVNICDITRLITRYLNGLKWRI